MHFIQSLTEADEAPNKHSAPADDFDVQPLVQKEIIMNFTSKSLRTIAATAALLGASAVWAAGPAAGEFSAVDQLEAAPSQGMTRATATIEAINSPQAAHKINNETLQNPQESTQLTRAQVREEGRLALRAGKIPAGDVSF